MDITTLLRANIRSKKGSFISVLILTFLIVAAAAASFGTRSNYLNAFDRAKETADAPDASCIISEKLLTDELLESVKNSSLVERVTVTDAIDRMGDSYINGNRDSNSWFFQELYDGIKLFTPEFDGLEEDIPPLAKGETYLPSGLRAKLECEIGDTAEITFSDGVHKFRIKGFVQEPVVGAMMIGWKKAFISAEDMAELREAVAPFETDNQTSYFKLVGIYKADKSLSDPKFMRELNLETGIGSKSAGTITGAQSANYTGLFLNIVLYVVIGFVIVLFVIVLVVISHGIKTETEMDFVNLGILKAQGFTGGRLTRVIMLRYILAELGGTVLGVIAAIPLERALGDVFKGITGIVPEKSVLSLYTALMAAGMLVLSVLVVLISSRRIARISPVRAISGGREEVYFSNRLNAPITGRGLDISIAYRAFSSSLKRYAGILFIIVMLTYFAVTVNIMSDMTESRTALEAMGGGIEDIGINYTNEKAAEHFDEFERIVESHSAIRKKQYAVNYYYSLNGDQVNTRIVMFPEQIDTMLKGKQPLLDNEIVITEAVSDALGIGIGDKVTIESRSGKAEYIVSGLFQTMNDTGYAISMGLDAAKRVGAKYVGYLGMMLEEPEKRDEIAAELREKFGDIIEVYSFDFEEEMGNDVTIIAARAMRIMIFAFAGVFALVAVVMVCSGAFNQERTDIGIYKALGFTSARLRMQFMLRFSIIALIGSVLGAVAGRFLSEPLLNTIFGLFGIVRVHPDSTPFTYIGAAAFICICTAVFAYIASRRVKRVSVRELISE